MKNRKWAFQIVLPSIQAGFTIAVFIILFVMEDMGISNFIWSSNYPVSSTDKVTFFIITFLKCSLTCVFLLLQKGAYIFKAIVSSVIGILTIIWLILLSGLFYSHVLESSDAPAILKISEGVAVITNLIIVCACIWSLRRSRRKTY